MEWLQKIYICILNPFCGISQKINDPTRKRLIYAVVLLLYSTCYIWYSFSISFKYTNEFFRKKDYFINTKIKSR